MKNYSVVYHKKKSKKKGGYNSDAQIVKYNGYCDNHTSQCMQSVSSTTCSAGGKKKKTVRRTRRKKRTNSLKK